MLGELTRWATTVDSQFSRKGPNATFPPVVAPDSARRRASANLRNTSLFVLPATLIRRRLPVIGWRPASILPTQRLQSSLSGTTPAVVALRAAAASPDARMAAFLGSRRGPTSTSYRPDEGGR